MSDTPTPAPTKDTDKAPAKPEAKAPAKEAETFDFASLVDAGAVIVQPDVVTAETVRAAGFSDAAIPFGAGVSGEFLRPERSV